MYFTGHSVALLAALVGPAYGIHDHVLVRRRSPTQSSSAILMEESGQTESGPYGSIRNITAAIYITESGPSQANVITSQATAEANDTRPHTHLSADTFAADLSAPAVFQAKGTAEANDTRPHTNLAADTFAADLSAPAMFQAIAGATAVVCSIVVGLYWRKGIWTVIMILTYLLALTTMKAAVKLVEKNNGFSHPLFLTATHFIFGSLVAFALILRKSWASGDKITAPSMSIFTTRFGPIAIFFAVSVAMGNFALVYSTTAFCEIIGATGPVWCLGLSFVMGQPIDLKLLGPCALVCIGCALTSDGEPKFSVLGFIFAAGAHIPRSLKGIFQQMLLQTDTTVYTPLDILAWTCLPSSVIMLLWSLLQEGTAPYRQWYGDGFASSLTLALLISCGNACILNLAVLFVVKDLGAVGQQIVAQSKSILVVLGGICFLHERFSRLEFVGLILVLSGVYLYNDLDARIKAKRKAEQPDESR